MTGNGRDVAARLQWLQLFFARPLAERAALGLLRDWAAASSAPQLILEARASSGGIEYLVGVQARHAAGVRRTVEALLPGTIVVAYPRDERTPITVARRLALTSHQRVLEPADRDASTRSVLAALAAVRMREVVTLQLVLGPRHRPADPPHALPNERQSIVSRLLTGVQSDTRPHSRDRVVRKLGSYGFSAVIRCGVNAPTAARRKELLLGVVSAVRTVSAPEVSLDLRPATPAQVNAPSSSWRWCARSSRLSVPEAGYLSAWPISERDEPLPGQPPIHPRPVLPAPALASGERVIGKSTAPGVTSAVGYDVLDRMRHTHVLGPNGTGKSVLLLNLLVQDLAAGQPVVVIEPKDLVRDLLERIPPRWQHRVAVLDPLDEAPIGINPLASSPTDQRSSAARADAVFAMFEGLYGDSLGPRSSDILRQALFAAALHDTPSLLLVPLLLADPQIRRPLVARAVAADPVAARGFWAWFESLSPETAATVTAPLANKLRPLLLPSVRRVLAQQSPRFNVRDVLSGNVALLVPLQKGVIGSAAAELLAAVVLAELWQGIRERAAVPESDRVPVSIVIDEVQDYLRLPTDLADALATARSLKASFTLAHQFESQLPRPIAEALRANARSKICFALSASDARTMATGQSVLTPEDFTHLPAYEVYAQLVRENTVQPWASARTNPPPAPTSDPEVIRARSRARFGRPAEAIEADFAELVRPGSHRNTASSYGRKART